MTDLPRIDGLHHVTAMTGEPNDNLRFYTHVLGQRLVKKTVNFDDPETYHFYFADAVGTPGTVMTTFPWPHAKPGTLGTGETRSVGYRAPQGSLDAWRDRLEQHGVPCAVEERLGEHVLAFRDPGGMRLDIVPSDAVPDAFEPWERGPVPADLELRGFHSVTLQLDRAGPTQELLEAMGFRESAREPGPRGERIRMEAPGARGSTVDLLAVGHRLPSAFGQGSVHHIAFRVPDADTQERVREALLERGLRVTDVRDRTYFRSIYAREAGGVLFEFATEPPGFTIDEDRASLGTGLKLPTWLESRREDLTAALPDLDKEAIFS